MTKKKYYAYYFDEKTNGIHDNWEDCKEVAYSIKARYKSFKTKLEAEIWIKQGGVYEIREKNEKNLKNIILENAVYFDAGTGRGKGVEVRVTNNKKESLLQKITSSNFKKFLKDNNWFINEYGNIQLDNNKTNNFGELLGLILAIRCAKKLKITKIFGDSNLVIKYWSKGFYHEDKLPKETVKFINFSIEERKNYEKNHGIIEHISGDFNPADLGFHK